MNRDEREELRSRLEAARNRYYDALRLAEKVGLPGVVGWTFVKCEAGEASHAGESEISSEELVKALRG